MDCTACFNRNICGAGGAKVTSVRELMVFPGETGTVSHLIADNIIYVSLLAHDCFCFTECWSSHGRLC